MLVVFIVAKLEWNRPRSTTNKNIPMLERWLDVSWFIAEFSTAR